MTDITIETERLKEVYRRLGPLGAVHIEAARVNGSIERLHITVFWTYTLVMPNSGTMGRLETLTERNSAGYSIFEALGKVLMDIDALESALRDGCAVDGGIDRPRRKT